MTDEQEAAAAEARREATLKRASDQGARGPEQVRISILKGSHQQAPLGYFTEGKMLRAYSKSRANRVEVIGNTVFPFDKNGLCEVVNQGNASLDFEVLCTLNHVQRLGDNEPVPTPVDEVPSEIIAAEVAPEPVAAEATPVPEAAASDEVVMEAAPEEEQAAGTEAAPDVAGSDDTSKLRRRSGRKQ